jgi:hypothetical protein
MTRRDYLRGLGLTAAAGLALAIVLRLISGANWFSFYGWAIIALLTLPAIAYLLWNRLPQTGRSKWRALIYIVPVALLAVIQIGYWFAFFTYGPGNPTFGIVREMVRMNAGFAFPWLAAALMAIWTWLFWSAAGRREHDGLTDLVQSAPNLTLPQ